MRLHLLSATLLAMLATAGCNPADERASPTTDPAGASAADAPASDATMATPGDDPALPAEPDMLRLDPDALPECGDPARVAVTWDAREAGVSGVDIIAVNRAGKESLFFTGGARGTRETGAWMRSGSQLVLRSKDDGAELDRAMVAGTPCVDGVPST